MIERTKDAISNVGKWWLDDPSRHRILRANDIPISNCALSISLANTSKWVRFFSTEKLKISFSLIYFLEYLSFYDLNLYVSLELILEMEKISNNAYKLFSTFETFHR